MIAKLSKVTAAIWLLLALMLGAWQILYSDRNDPKNLRYVLWKHGLASFDLDQACATMSHDAPDTLVLGKSKAEIEQKFGYLTSPAMAGPYYAHAYYSQWKGMDAAYIRHSPWLVVFHDGKATQLVLVKGL